MDVAARIIELRNKRGLSQTRLALLAEFSQGALNVLEKGGSNANVVTLEKLCNALGVTLCEFFDEGFDPDPLELELLAAFRSLPDKQKEQAIKLVKALL